MKVLLDENLPNKLRNALPGRDVVTVDYMRWSGLKNGDLLQTAELHGIDVLVAADQSLPYEQTLAGRQIAVVVLSAQEWPMIREHLSMIERAIDSAAPGSFTPVHCGLFRRVPRKIGGFGA